MRFPERTVEPRRLRWPIFNQSVIHVSNQRFEADTSVLRRISLLRAQHAGRTRAGLCTTGLTSGAALEHGHRRQPPARPGVLCASDGRKNGPMAAEICLMAAFDESRRDFGAGEESRPLDGFLRGVERRALRMAELATGSRDE